MAKFRDETTGLLYKQEQQSSDYRQVSIQVAAPCLPTEAANKEYVDGLETRLNDLIHAIHNGLTADDVAKLLQPIKDAIDALKTDDDSALANRIAALEETVAKLVKAGVGTVTIVNQGAILRYYNLGLGSIAYKDIVLCGRKIVETSITLDLNLGNRDYTPLALRRVSAGKKFVESLELPCTDLDDTGKIILYFQGANHYPVGELQLVVAVEGGIDGIDASDIVIPPDLVARIEEVLGQNLAFSSPIVGNAPAAGAVDAPSTPAAQVDSAPVPVDPAPAIAAQPAEPVPAVVDPPPTMPTSNIVTESMSSSDGRSAKKKAETIPHELKFGEKSIDLDSEGNVIWHIGGVPFINGKALEICAVGDRVFRHDNASFFETGITQPDWQPISEADYHAAVALAEDVAKPRIHS